MCTEHGVDAGCECESFSARWLKKADKARKKTTSPSIETLRIPDELTTLKSTTPTSNQKKPKVEVVVSPQSTTPTSNQKKPEVGVVVSPQSTNHTPKPSLKETASALTVQSQSLSNRTTPTSVYPVAEPEAPPPLVSDLRTIRPGPVCFADKRRKILQDAVLDTISGRKSTDTEIPVFSQRTRKGVVHGLKKIHARSTLLLAASSSFASVIIQHAFGDKSTSVLRATSAVYGYEDDSDLEDFEETLDARMQPSDSDSHRMKRQDSVDSTLATLQEDFESDTSSISELLQEAHSITLTNTSSSPQVASGVTSNPKINSNSLEPSTAKIQVGLATQDATLKKENGAPPINLDAAYRTWQALLVYLHSDTINFSQLKSRRRTQDHKAANTSLSCSPKSMYRLAVKFDLETLKEEAASAIFRQLSSENIIQELFSDFTWRHPEILKIEAEIYHKLSKRPEVQAELMTVCKGVARGEYPNSAVVLESLFERLTQ